MWLVKKEVRLGWFNMFSLVKLKDVLLLILIGRLINLEYCMVVIKLFFIWLLINFVLG